MESHHEEGAELHTSKQMEDWLATEVLLDSYSGINFEPRVPLLLKVSAGRRGPLAFGCVLFHCSHLCQGLWGLEGSGSTLVF